MEEAVAALESVKGVERHPYLVRLGDKSTGGAAGGAKSGVSAASVDSLPHARSVQMAAADEFYSVFVTHAEKNDDNFDLDDWSQTVQDTDGSRCRNAASVAAYRLTEVNVGDQGVYRKLTQVIPKLPLYPKKNPRIAAELIKA